MKTLKLLFIGDIVGRAGRNAVKAALPQFRNDADIVIANAENSAGGFGLTEKVYKELQKAGIDFFTGGNHIFDKAEVKRQRDSFPLLTTPANLGEESCISHTTATGAKLAIINLVGRVFMQENAADPFATFDRLYEKHGVGSIVMVDFHAEATSEKAAFAEYTAGRAAAILGTHTHVQTADERILAHGAFFISDVGACCAKNSVLGMTVESSLSRFINPIKAKMKVELSGPLMFNAVKLHIDTDLQRVYEFERINVIQE